MRSERLWFSTALTNHPRVVAFGASSTVGASTAPRVSTTGGAAELSHTIEPHAGQHRQHEHLAAVRLPDPAGGTTAGSSGRAAVVPSRGVAGKIGSASVGAPVSVGS